MYPMTVDPATVYVTRQVIDMRSPTLAAMVTSPGPNFN
jgi:hypothetical protein